MKNRHTGTRHDGTLQVEHKGFCARAHCQKQAVLTDVYSGVSFLPFFYNNNISFTTDILFIIPYKSDIKNVVIALVVTVCKLDYSL